MNIREIETVTIADIVQTKLLTCRSTDTVLVASRKMVKQQCSSILVIDDQEVIGIWTEKDALKHEFSLLKIGQVLISEVMSSPVKSIKSTMSLEQVSSEFRKDGFRHYLVLDEQGQRLGIISQTDVVFKYSLEYYLVPRSVSSVTHSGIPTLNFDSPLTQATTLMKERRVDALIVRFSDNQHGIITERDIIKAIAAGKKNPQVVDYASKGLITINKDASLYQAKLLMLEKKIRHLGVVDNNQLISIINLENILEGMLNSYLEELRHLVVEQKQALERSSAHLHLAHKVITAALEGIIITDDKGIIQSCNPAFTRITGYTELEAVGKTAAILQSGRHDKAFYTAMWTSIKEQGYWQGEVWNRKKNNEIYPQSLAISAIYDKKTKQITHYAGVFNDISQKKASEEKIFQLAYYDPLTGLANRRLFFDRLEQQIALSTRSKQQFALIFLDLDKFKPINDNYGHTAGDFLLQQVAKRLNVVLRDADTIARIGGDEFVVLLTEQDKDMAISKQQIKGVTDKISHRLSEPCSFEGQSFSITVSMGISIFHEGSTTAEELLKQADKAMYYSKNQGRDQSHFYSSDKNE